MSKQACIFVVDQDTASSRTTCEFAKSMDLPSRTFPTAEEFLAQYEPCVGCVVTELRLCGMSGLDLQSRLGGAMPVVFVTAFAETRLTVRAMSQGAVNVLEKPIDKQALWDALHSAVARSKSERLTNQAQLPTELEFVGRVFHEINQPLTVINNLSTTIGSLIQQQQVDLKKIRDWNRMISDASQLAGEIINRFRTIFLQRAVQRSSESLENLIRESVSMLQFATDADKYVNVVVGSNPLSVNIDRVQIQQVVMNLVKNALEATSQVPPNERLVVVKLISHPDSAEIVVSDNGEGIQSSEAGFLFEHIHSSKSDGLGIGLTICKSIVESHGGRIWYEPNRPSGASFHVSLPVSGP